MDSKRQQKVSRLLQKDLGEILQRNAIISLNGAMVTVTIVKVTPDLAQARIYLSVFPDSSRVMVFDKIEENAKTIKQELAKRIRHQVRVIPELLYYVDDTAEVSAHVARLFDNIHIPPVDPNDNDA